MNPRRQDYGDSLQTMSTVGNPQNEQTRILAQESFLRMIAVERKRAERSHKSFLLMLLDAGTHPVPHNNGNNGNNRLANILVALSARTRETDIVGWYKDDSVVGVMFTEIPDQDRKQIVGTMLARVSHDLRSQLTFEQCRQISITFHLFPEEWQQEPPDGPTDSAFYPDLHKRDDARRISRILKRAMDILGSAVALLLVAPFFFVIAAAIKLTSEGPVLFRQQRVGQFGVPFVFLKFRSMYHGSDTSVHEQYLKEFVGGKAERHATKGSEEGAYKLTDDARITKVGEFLRRTSLDELPQFWNVLKGEMSLVGPRPAIGYEVAAYDLWHRRRLLEAKPGITGLWQVNGRSRVKFDDMVRFDLEYARTWSPWLDLKILARTPRAVVLGEGAY